jgi:hypothetical protein
MEHDYYSYLQDERRTPYPDDDEALVARQAHLAGQGRFVAIFFGLLNRPKRAVARSSSRRSAREQGASK